MKITLDQLAAELYTTIWSKGDIRRIYMNSYNTKKATTCAYIYEVDGEFKVFVKVQCPSQPTSWAIGQERVIRERITAKIEEAVEDILAAAQA